MCGIACAVGEQDVERFVRGAQHIQRHRGPDDESIEFERHGRFALAFGHRRLSILDLSARGRQPMSSRSGRTLIIFDGEIYNYKELAANYGLRNLRSRTDTEVAVELVDLLGLERASQKFNGMWSIVSYDRESKRLSLSRDCFGEKPLHTLQFGGNIYIASELKAFFSIDGFSPEPNLAVVGRFISQLLQNVGEDTWLQGVQSFPQASIGEIDLTQPTLGLTNVRRYWVADKGEMSIARSDAEWASHLRHTLSDATALRLNADVPVGIALSGGVDSSTLAALSQAVSTNRHQDVTLLSVSHPGSSQDETPFVESMSRFLGKGVHKYSHTLEVDKIPKLLAHCNHVNDGPLPSLSPLLFYKLMEAARGQGLKVVLTGQGADEVFCGYRKYPALELRRLLLKGQISQASALAAGFLRQKTWLQNFKMSEAKRYWGHLNTNLLGEALSPVAQAEDIWRAKGVVERQVLDLERYSVPFLTHYEDRMGMANSVEVRSPYLDHRVVELGLSLPTSLKMKNGWTKFLLRSTFTDLLPPQNSWRKDKKGFSNPEAEWFRGPLRQHILDVMGDASNLVYQLGLIDRRAYMSALLKFQKGSSMIWFRDIFAPFSLSVWLDTIRRGSIEVPRL